MGFFFGLCFTVSIALMFQSLSIGASSRTVADNCFRSDGAGSVSILQSSVQTSGGGGGGASEFSDVGGERVVMLCTAFKLVEGWVAGKLNEAFKKKEAPKAYELIGLAVPDLSSFNSDHNS
jgi:hypothetical protein